MDGIIDDNKLLEWGRMVYEKAKLIRKYEIHHHNKLSEFLDEIKKNNDIVELDLNKLRGYTLKGFDLRGHILSDNCTVVNVYWLESILNFHKYKHSETDAIIDIVEESRFYNIFEKFKARDFYFNYKNELIYELRWESRLQSKGVSIKVPYTIGKLQLELLIMVVEAITNTYINRIYMFYVDEENEELMEELGGPPIDLYEIYFFDTDAIEEIMELQNLPFIKSSEFVDKKFTDLNSWYLEVPQFKKYIDDYNKPKEEFPF